MMQSWHTVKDTVAEQLRHTKAQTSWSAKSTVSMWYHFQCYQEERICSQQTMDSTTYHGCHRRSVSDLYPLIVHKRGISHLHQSVNWTVSRLLSAI